MATKKTKNSKGTETNMKTTKAKKNESKKAETKKPAEAAVEARAEAVEALDGLGAEARAEAVEALDEAGPRLYEAEHAGEKVQVTVPESEAADAQPAEPDAGARAAAFLRELGFERTGKILQETRPETLTSTAERWRDAETERDRAEDANVLACAGWFRRADAPTLTALPLGEPGTEPAPRADNPDIAALRAEVVDAKAGLEAAEAEAKKVEEQARAALAKAKERYRAALAPYRDACKVQGRDCEFEGGGRGSNVSERVTFEVELQGGQVRIAVKGKPETEERYPVEEVRAAINKTAYGYTDKHVGPREVVGNKGGTLSNRLRTVLGAGAGA